MHNNDNSNTQC